MATVFLLKVVVHDFCAGSLDIYMHSKTAEGHQISPWVSNFLRNVLRLIPNALDALL